MTLVHRRILTDEQRCISCGTCMAACMMAHCFNTLDPKPRISLVQTRSLSVPVVCRQCTDPDCAHACPQHALYSDGDKISIHKELCIGCGECCSACPSGSIRLVRERRLVPFSDLQLGSFYQARPVKCDLCESRAQGPACVEVCPSQSLRIVNTSEYDKVEDLYRNGELKVLDPVHVGQELLA